MISLSLKTELLKTTNILLTNYHPLTTNSLLLFLHLISPLFAIYGIAEEQEELTDVSSLLVNEHFTLVECSVVAVLTFVWLLFLMDSSNMFVLNKVQLVNLYT